MNDILILTGASGHLGTAIIKLLAKSNYDIRCLIMPTDDVKENKKITYVRGDITDIESLRPLFANSEHRNIYVIHAAGKIDISEHVSDSTYNVNVNGTKNILQLSKENNVKRFLYVSSVHALPEKNKNDTITEINNFSANEVIGGYAKTKAEATQSVLDAAKDGLNVVIVHPSGIIGPYGNESNHLVQMIADYINGDLPACVKGGYDFVDVRDVAEGCLSALKKGKANNCYILSNKHYDIKEVLEMTRVITKKKKKLTVLPIWIAKLAAPFIQLAAKIKKRRPLYTSYSLHTLTSNDNFSHDKATKELGYKPRSIKQTIRDTISWIKKHHNKNKEKN